MAFDTDAGAMMASPEEFTGVLQNMYLPRDKKHIESKLVCEICVIRSVDGGC